MKTSTFLAGAGILFAFATVTAANLKIKSEYSKGKIQSPYTRTKLAPFRFIKENLDSSTGMPTIFNVNVGKGIDPCLDIFYSLPMGYLYTVSNDTLFISLDPANKEGYSYGEPVVINTPTLEGLEVSKGLYYINHSDSGQLSVKTSGKSAANFKLEKISRLILDAAGRSKITIAAKQPIDEAVMHFTGKSMLGLENTVIRKKTMQFKEGAWLHLSGASLENFGVKGN
jgi:hypothetical protein